MPAPSGFLTALGMAFTGYGKDQSLRDAEEQRQAVAEEQAKKDALAAQARAQARYLQGFRPGTAPNVGAINQGNTIAAGFGAVGTPAPQADPNRFQQVDPTSYLDTTQTPEAQQQRRATAADLVKQANEAKAHREKVQAMVGVTLPNGTTITPQLAEAMIANPSLGGAFAKVPSPEKPDPISIVQGVGDDGKPRFFRINKNGGPATEVEGIASKPGAGGAMTGQTMLAAGRIGMSYADLKSAVDQMEEFEKNPDNVAKFTPAQRMLGEVSQAVPNGEAHGLMGMLGNAGTTMMSGIAQGHLAADDPALQNYLFNKQRVATALTELLPRPNQQLLGIEKGLSGIEVGGNPAQIANVQARRRAGLTMLQQIMDKGGIGPGASAPHPPAAPTPAAPAPTVPRSRPPLAERIQQLKAAGVPRAQAMQTLQQEGYDLHGGD